LWGVPEFYFLNALAVLVVPVEFVPSTHRCMTKSNLNIIWYYHRSISIC